MPELRRYQLPALVAALALLLAAASPPPAPQIPRYIESPISRKIANLLVAGDAKGVARALAYPEDYTPQQLEEDRTAITAGVEAMLRSFGKPRDVKSVQSGLRFYEIGLFNGPKPYWWEKDNTRENTRQYFYEADFASHGYGYIKVMTRTGKGPEGAVAVALCLPADRSPSRVRMRAAYQAVLDSQGAPPNHPIRKVEIPVLEVPAAKAR